MKLGVIGGGAMGEAIISAVLKAGIVTAADVSVAERYKERLAYLTKTYGVNAATGPADAANGADFVLLAVKPQEFEKAAQETGGALKNAVAISIMAGLTIEQIARATAATAVIRSMPNTPAQIGEGMTAWTATAEVSEEARAGARSIFAAMGQEAYVPSEHYLDMVTALSGSGPAYVFLFIEALIEAGVYIGLGRDLATQMAMQTVVGSSLFARQSDKTVSELRGLVTSAGGTTAAALREMEAGGLRSTILEGVIAAFERSKELGEHR